MAEYYGVRRWRLGKRPRAGWTLMSLYSNMIWRPGQPAVAFCSTTKERKLCEVIGGNHQCGIWACRDDMGLKMQRVPKGPYIEGGVLLIGTVYDHESIARGSLALPASFWIPSLHGTSFTPDLEKFLKLFEVPLLHWSSTI